MLGRAEMTHKLWCYQNFVQLTVTRPDNYDSDQVLSTICRHVDLDLLTAPCCRCHLICYLFRTFLHELEESSQVLLTS